MSVRLSWGRRSPADVSSAAVRRSIVLVIAVLVGLVASVDGFVHRSYADAEARAAVQSMLDQHLRTLERGDFFPYERTLERKDPEHTHCFTELFEMGEARIHALRPNQLSGLEEASRTTPLGRAYVERRDGIATEYVRRAQVVNFLTLPPFDFRSVFYVWYLAAPTEAELGDERRLEGEGVAVLYMEIDEPVAAAVVREAELAREAVETARADPEPIQLRLAPGRELTGRAGCMEGAAYEPSADEIVLVPLWADAERSSLSTWSRERLAAAVRQWAARGG